MVPDQPLDAEGPGGQMNGGESRVHSPAGHDRRSQSSLTEGLSAGRPRAEPPVGTETPAVTADGQGGRQPKIPVGRRIWQPVLAFLIWLLTRMEIRGVGQLPQCGAGIVFYNHIHWLDPVLICGTLPRYAVPLTKIEASRWPLVGWLLRWYHVVFIRRGNVDRAALTATWQEMKAGGISVISPEGTRSEEGTLQVAKEGLAFIARHVPDAWLMPCGVVGTPHFESTWKKWRRPTITLTYGRPFRFRWPQEKVGRDVLREMTDEAMAQLASVLPPVMRGDYRDTDPSQTQWLEFMDEGDWMRSTFNPCR